MLFCADISLSGRILTGSAPALLSACGTGIAAGPIVVRLDGVGVDSWGGDEAFPAGASEISGSWNFSFQFFCKNDRA